MPGPKPGIVVSAPFFFSPPIPMLLTTLLLLASALFGPTIHLRLSSPGYAPADLTRPLLSGGELDTPRLTALAAAPGFGPRQAATK